MEVDAPQEPTLPPVALDDEIEQGCEVCKGTGFIKVARTDLMDTTGSDIQQPCPSCQDGAAQVLDDHGAGAAGVTAPSDPGTMVSDLPSVKDAFLVRKQDLKDLHHHKAYPISDVSGFWKLQIPRQELEELNLPDHAIAVT